MNQPQRTRLVSVLLAVAAIFPLSTSSQVRGSNDPSPATDAEIAGLVSQLGDKSYVAREEASRALCRAGLKARDPLYAALASPDREVRIRASQALSAVLEADFRVRLEAFARDSNREESHGLAGWRRFKALLGAKASRELFVTMHRAEPALMASLDSEPAVISQALLSATPVFNRDWREEFVESEEGSLGSVAALMMASVTEGVAIPESTGRHVINKILQRIKLERGIDGAASKDLKKLIGQWILAEQEPAITAQNLRLAMAYEYPEGRSLAVRILETNQPTAMVREMALLAIGKLGGREHLPLVEKFLEDTSIPPENMGRPTTPVQIRDIALAVLLHLTEQNAAEYGFNRIQPDAMTVFRPSSASFEDAAAREAALGRWRAWSAEHAK